MTAMTHPDRSAISEFASWTDGPVVSVFLPLDPKRPDLDAIQVKSAVQWAEERLVKEFGQDPSAAAAILGPLSGAALAPAAPGRGAAWYLAPGRATCVPLPSEVGPAVSIGAVPDTLRLLPFVSDGPEYYVLAISQRRARVFRANRFDIEPVVVAGMPKGVEETQRDVERDATFNRHGSGTMHAGGAGTDLHKADVHQYLHQVDRALAPVLAGSHAPLVVIGVGYEASMFINESHYRHVVETAVVGNPDTLDVADIHARSLEVVAGLPGPAQAAAARARDLAGTGRAVTNLDEILSSAISGSVDQFLVARSAADGPNAQSALGADRTRLARALNAAVATGATAFVVDDTELPAGAAAAAVLRY